MRYLGVKITYILKYWHFIKFNELFSKNSVHFIHVTCMCPIWIMNACYHTQINTVTGSWSKGISRNKRKKKERKNKAPANVKPAFLQATAVIIIWEPSREWTKFGGKAVLCLFTMTYEERKTITFKFWPESYEKMNLTMISWKNMDTD